MPKETERAFQRRVIVLVKKLGWRVAHFASVRVLTPDGRARWMTPVQGDGKGFPDLILLRGKRCVVLELKTEGGVLEEEQADWLAAFEAAGIERRIFYPHQWNQLKAFLT